MKDLALIDFKLPPLKDLTDEERLDQLGSSLSQTWSGVESEDAVPPHSSQAGGSSPAEKWMLLLERMITRVSEPPPSMSGVNDAADGGGTGGVTMKNTNGEVDGENGYYATRSVEAGAARVRHGRFFCKVGFFIFS